jgi:hypothetical protein
MCENKPVEVSKLNSPDMLRTRNQTNLLAHSVCGTCPGCGLVITPENLAKVGGKPPWGVRRGQKWEHVHLGVTYGQFCLVHIEPQDWVTDLLHVNLCQLKGLWEKLILPNVDKVLVGGDEPQAERIIAILKLIGLYIRPAKLKKASKNVSQGVKWQQLKSHSFHGRDAEDTLLVIDLIIDVIYPPDSPFNNIKTANANLKAVFGAWRDVYAHLRDRRWEDDGVGGPNRQAYADTYETLVTKYIGLWVKACQGATEGLYIHILRVHVKSELLQYGSLVPYSVQGLEHNNSIRKRFLRYCTNKKVDVSNQNMTRIAQVLRRQLIIHTITNQGVARSHAIKRALQKWARMRQKKAKLLKIEAGLASLAPANAAAVSSLTS